MSSIIEDQLVTLNDVGICVDVLRVENDLRMTELLFEPGADRAEEHTRTTKGEEHELMNSQIQSLTERQK